jgi:hypothetical protein
LVTEIAFWNSTTERDQPIFLPILLPTGEGLKSLHVQELRVKICNLLGNIQRFFSAVIADTYPYG